MTHMKPCSVTDGRVLAANNNKHLTIGEHRGIIRHNCSFSITTGEEEHQVALDFHSEVATSGGPASAESEAIIQRLFPDLAKRVPPGRTSA